MLELDLLGTPNIRLDGIAPDGSLFAKELALLYYLAAAGRPQPRTSLAVLLWGDLNDAAARGNLRKSLSLLRQSFDAWIVADRDTIGLTPEHVACDVRRFEQLAQDGLSQGVEEKMQAAIDLYRGDFLQGFAVRNAPDYELWLAHTQERLRGVAVRLLEELAHGHRRRRAHAEAVACLRQILAMEPWREETHRQLMEALAADGQRSAALRQYEFCVDCLASELGVEPSVETQALYEKIRSGASSAANVAAETVPGQASPRRRARLPAELSPLVGRERELAELGAMLAQPDCRAITIVGPGGIGKTRLALALAHRHQAAFAAAAWQSVAGLVTASELVTVAAQAFDLDGVADGNATDRLQQVEGRLLLVIDNFEHLLPGGVAEVEALLSAVPGLVCVVTSREALAASWEWRYAVDELPFPANAEETNLGDYAAVQLFLQLARRTRPRYAIQRAELPDVVRICQLVGGLPLGIEFAAAQVGRLPCAAIADNLAAGLDTLDAMQEGTLRDLPARQRSLLASFEASWQMLAPEEQRVLATLSVLRGEFTVEAALAIADTTAVSIMRLVDKSLIRLVAVDRYGLHEVIRRLAERKLEETSGAAAAAFERYKDYYLALTKGTLRALFTRLNTTPDLRGYLHSLRGHLHYIWQRVAGGPDAAVAAVALSSVEMTLRTYEMGVAGDTMLLLEQTRQVAIQSLPYRDVVPLDLIWLPGMVDDVLDLSGPLAEEQNGLLPVLAQNCRIDGRLLAFPYMLDVGALYYRRDLLEKYGFGGPPRTWAELERMAAHIQACERAAGHPDFWGYIWQGYPSEHLNCNALEWQHSEGGGLVVDEHGAVTVYNARTIAALEQARSWIGTISPPSVSESHEGDSLRDWCSGEAAFMRLWTVGYPILDDPVVGDCTGLTVLPAGAARHAATLGGWPLTIRAAAADPGKALKLLMDITSEPAQRARALAQNPHPPSLRALYDDPELLARHPIYRQILALIEAGGLAIRPAKVAGRRYPQVSSAYTKAVAAVLYAGEDAATAMAQLAETLVSLLADDS